MRTVVAAVIGALVGALALASAVVAQQPVKAPSVITPHGFIVEEVRVGASCVVIVSRTEFRVLDTIPCGN
jgi:hypothetical protein